MASASDRNLIDFGLMLGRKSSPMCGNVVTAGAHWNNYGCYCGRGNKCPEGTEFTSGCPGVDDFDAACEAHDQCYDENDACSRAPAGILLDYPWRVVRGEVSS